MSNEDEDADRQARLKMLLGRRHYRALLIMKAWEKQARQEELANPGAGPRLPKLPIKPLDLALLLTVLAGAAVQIFGVESFLSFLKMALLFVPDATIIICSILELRRKTFSKRILPALSKLRKSHRRLPII